MRAVDLEILKELSEADGIGGREKKYPECEEICRRSS